MGYLICFGEIVRWIGFGLLLGNTNTHKMKSIKGEGIKTGRERKTHPHFLLRDQ